MKFADLKAEYARLWQAMEITHLSTVDSICARLERHKPMYQAVSKLTGVPWFVIAALHNRESDADVTTYLGNGDRLDQPTTHVPRGRGPFQSWQEGAVDALQLDGLDKVGAGNWTPERACYEVEKFNGFGYRNYGIQSPYLWSFTNNYVSGKYVSDGQFDQFAVDRQCGAMPIIKRLMERSNESWGAPSRAAENTAGGAIVVAGGAAAHQAAQAGIHPALIIAILIVTCAIAALVWHMVAATKGQQP